MIPALILYLIKRFKRKSNSSKNSNAIKKLSAKLKSILFLVAITSFFAFTNIEERKALTYNVLKNNKVIGVIKIDKSALADSVVYTLESEIKAKFLFKFNITGKEKSIYRNGKLVYSSVFRTLNKKPKTNHEIVLKDGKYQLHSSKTLQNLELDLVKQNLITLYFKEPIGVTSIFCDNLMKTVRIKPLGNSKYKVDFSNGKYNIFHYNDGKCIKIEAVSNLFSVTLIPTIL